MHAHGVQRAQPAQAPAQRAGTQRHVLVEGLVAGVAAREEALGRALAEEAGVVVLHLMVVPGHDPGAGAVRGLQVGIGAVERVAVAVVGQRRGHRQRVGARQRMARRLGRHGVFVDVVAQEQHGVQVFVHHVAVGGVVAVLPALARGEGQAHALRQRLGRRGGAGARHGRGRVAVHEAVEVPAVRLQAGHLDMHGMAQRRQRRGLALAHDAAKAFVLGDFPAHGQRVGQAAAGRAGGHGAGHRAVQQAGPEHEAVGRRRAAGHAQRKERALRQGGGPAPARLPGGGSGGRCQADEFTALHGSVSRRHGGRPATRTPVDALRFS